jgi:ABC-2 type transport system ATP-binding protein
VPGAAVYGVDGRQAVYRFARDEVTASELIGRLSDRYRILDLAVREPDVEATVRRIYEEHLLEQA